MARLNDANVSIPREIIGRYPRPQTALIPLLHISWLTLAWDFERCAAFQAARGPDTVPFAPRRSDFPQAA